MVFYFSGTGNSYQAAQAMLSPGEAMEDMAKCVWEKRFSFFLAPGEPVGFVCPVYYGGIPAPVKTFIQNLSLETAPEYCYGLLTCGGSPAAAGEMMAKLLKKQGVTMKSVFSVTMPDNYILMYKISGEEEQKEILSKAALWLEHIKKQVDQRQETGVRASVKDRMLTAAMYPLYENDRSTKPFYADDQCVGCGLCAQRCPAHAIVMEDKRPKWVLDKCYQCLACARCGAIQYGKRTVGKKRYTNPILKKGGGGHGHDDAPDMEEHAHGAPAPAGGHDHGAAAPAGGHDHGGDDNCCCADEGAEGHQH